MTPALLVLAAGIGSRYGGLKQLEPMSEQHETLLDFSIYDAVQAGVTRIVFVIRRNIEKDIKAYFLNRLPNTLTVDFVYQELDLLPAGFTPPTGRVKPWGTGHAILTAADALSQPFIVINADDFYGRKAIRDVVDFLDSLEESEKPQYCLAGYMLHKTLSEHGSVSRGVCDVDEHGFLKRIVERRRIFRKNDRIVYEENGASGFLATETPVSLNLIGLTPSFFGSAWSCFEAFLAKSRDSLKAEFLLPQILNELIETGSARVRILPTEERWFGVTYREDRLAVQRRIAGLKQQGVYPISLWQPN